MNRCFEIFEFSVSIALTRRLNVFCPTGTRNLIQITGPSLTIAGKKSRPFRSRCRASRTSPRASWFQFLGVARLFAQQEGLSDADWAADRETRRSGSEAAIYFGGCQALSSSMEV